MIKFSITRKMLFLLMIISVIYCGNAGKVFAEDVTIYLDGERLAADVAPEIKNGITFVPVRVISESLGANIDYYFWEEDNREEVTISNYTDEPQHRQQKFANGSVADWWESTIRITANNPIISIGYNGIVQGNAEPRFWDDEDEIKLAEAPYVKNQRMMVPLRFIAERMDFQVDYRTDGSIWLTSGYTIMLDSVKVKDMLLEKDMQYVTTNKVLIKQTVNMLEKSRQEICGEVSNYAYIMPQLTFRNSTDDIIAIWQFAAPSTDNFTEQPFSTVFLHDRLNDCWYNVDEQMFNKEYSLLFSNFVPPYYSFEKLKKDSK